MGPLYVSGAGANLDWEGGAAVVVALLAILAYGYLVEIPLQRRAARAPATAEPEPDEQFVPFDPDACTSCAGTGLVLVHGGRVDLRSFYGSCRACGGTGDRSGL